MYRSAFHLILCLVTLHALLASTNVTAAEPPSAQEERAISHANAVRLATDQNIGILIDAMAREVATLRAREARRPYVPVVFLQPEYSAAHNLLTVPPRRTSSFDASGGVRWNNQWGTSLAVRAITTPWYDGFAPQPLTALETSLGQSLLRDGWGSSNLLDIVDSEVELQRSVFVDQLNDLLVRVDRAYWELAYSQADVEIKERSRDRAQEQYEDTKENIRRGLLAPGDIFVVEENVVIFEEQLLRSREQLALAQLRLARLLQLEDAASELRAADTLDQPDIQLPTRDSALDTAMRENPLLEANRIAVRQAEIQLEYDTNQSRPVLDLNASLQLNGLSDNQADAWQQTITGDNPSVRVGLYFELPLVGGPYRARVKRADLERRQQLHRLKDAESDVTYEVRELLTQLESRVRALAFAQRRIELAENKLQTERDKYQRGLSTLTDVVRFQRDLDGARISERRARLDVIILRAQLSDAQGILYRLAGVEVR